MGPLNFKNEELKTTLKVLGEYQKQVNNKIRML